MAVNVAKECLLAATKADPRAAHIWTNLANAYYLIGDHRSSGKCLEKVFLAPRSDYFEHSLPIIFIFFGVPPRGKKLYGVS